MTLLRYLFEGTNGTDVSNNTPAAANIVSTPSGFACTATANGAASTMTLSNDFTHTGGTSLKFLCAAAVTQIIRLPYAASNATVAFSGYHYSTAAPTSSVVIATIQNASDIGGRFFLATNGAISLQNAAGTTIGTTAAGAWVANRWNRIEVVLTSGSTTGAGSLSVYNADSGTATGTISVTNTDMGTANFSKVDLGTPTNTSGAITHYWEDVQLRDGGSGEIGPYAPANTPPTVAVTANQDVAAAASVSATATATDSDGTIASYAWTVAYSSTTSPTLTGASTATVSLTAPAAGNLVTLQCVVTDNGGATTTVTTEVRVPTTGSFATLPGAGSGATWTNTGGASSEGVALSDASDTTYIESPAFIATASTHKFRLQPLTTRSDLTLTSRSLLTALGGTVLVRLLEGTTQRQQWTVTQSTTVNDQSLAVTTPSAISDWGNLWVEYSVAS